MEYVTVVNRTRRELTGVWDGIRHTVVSGKNAFPLAIAEAVKRQNPIMGSDDPMTGHLQYLVGIEEQGDDCSPVEQSDEIELYNRQFLKNAVPIQIVPGNVGMYSVKRNDMGPTLPLDSAFVKP